MNEPVFYNDNDAYCAQWLRNLIEAGHLPAGDVDGRSIVDVRPDDVAGYIQCHWFGGVGGWAYALKLAGWPSDREVWTGSCPCQPLSSAGLGLGHADERHLWPAFYALIAECRPATIFGEQVASKDGREWLAGVRADLERLGYAVGAADLPAAGVGAPHIRQRLFWVGQSEDERYCGAATARRETEYRTEQRGAASGLADADEARPKHVGRQGLSGNGYAPYGNDADRCGTTDFWHGGWLPCLDGKARRVKPGIFPLASRLPQAMDGGGPISRVGALRGAGNAIVPQLAAEFISAWMETNE